MLLLFPIKSSVITLLHGGGLILHRTCVTNLWSHSSFLLAFLGRKVNSMELKGWLSVSHRLLFVFNNTAAVHRLSCRSLFFYIAIISPASLRLCLQECDAVKVKVQKSEPKVAQCDIGRVVVLLSCSPATRKDERCLPFKVKDVKVTLKRAVSFRFIFSCGFCAAANVATEDNKAPG